MFSHYFADICAVRLDFETFVTVAPTKTDESSTACNDKFRSETVSSIQQQRCSKDIRPHVHCAFEGTKTC